MAFAVEDFEDLIRLLEERPEWRKRLRDSLVSDDIARLEKGLADLLESGRQLQSSMAEFRAASEARLREIDSRIDSIDRRMESVDSRMESIDNRVTSVDARMGSLNHGLTSRMDSMTNEFGVMYKTRFISSPESFFGKWIKRPQRLRVTELDELDAAMESGALTEEEQVQLLLLDLLLRGYDRATPGATVYLAVEVSRTINVDDVDRAADRARLLGRLGLNARPAVGGARITDVAQGRADQVNALVVLARV